MLWVYVVLQNECCGNLCQLQLFEDTNTTGRIVLCRGKGFCGHMRSVGGEDIHLLLLLAEETIRVMVLQLNFRV